MDVNEIKRKILAVMILALEISPPDKTEHIEDAPHVFVDYAPHVASLNVKIYLHGWAKDAKADRIFDMSLGGFYDSDGHFYGMRRGDSIDDAIAYLTDLHKTVKQNA